MRESEREAGEFLTEGQDSNSEDRVGNYTKFSIFIKRLESDA